MKRLLSILSVSLLICSPLAAQQNKTSKDDDKLPRILWTDSSAQANPRFEAMVTAATTKMSDHFRFGHFRSIYAETRQYDPLGDDVVEKMQELAYKVQTAEDFDKKNTALEEYRQLVKDHLANMRVITQALSFSKLDSTFGSPVFFRWLRKGIMRDILRTGDGNTLRTAYSVVTLSEETSLVGQLGYTILDTQSAREGGLFYNMHEVEEIGTGQKKTLFVNTSTPMRFVHYQQQENGRVYNILRQ